MFKIDSAGAVAGAFTEGDPSLGEQPTIVSADWLNAVQTELVNVIQSVGIVLDKTNSAQLLAAITAILGVQKAYKRDFLPGGNPPSLTIASFLAQSYVDMGVTPTTNGELFSSHAQGSDSTLHSMVVNATAACSCNVIVPVYDDQVILFVDGVAKNTWSGPGEGTAAYAMALTAGNHVIQFLELNGFSGGPSNCFVNNWMAGQPVTFLRAAHA